ncbi:hypothetical protein HYW18_01580 [Candidatus Uhrbacteria bacterium]|nr:hypothetical protein [Candidatus Uhrbacteria bacterium]
MMRGIERYHEAVAFLESLSKIQKEDYMSPIANRAKCIARLRFLLREIGNPEQTIPHFVHVGGTSGKGTTTMMIANGLSADGYKVGAYTSPHVTTVIERLWVSGKLMKAEEFTELVHWIKPALLACLEKSRFGIPSLLETEFAIALEYFRRQKCTWAVVEVGCGGEFDATNVIPPPRVAVLTNVGLDHTEILGKTTTAIAKTKAGIFKRGSAVFTSEHDKKIGALLMREATRLGVASFTRVTGSNGEVAEEVLRYLGVSTSAIRRAHRETRLPGRREVVTTKPFVMLDGAHNPDKMRYSVTEWQKAGHGKATVVFGIAADKDAQEILRALSPITRRFYFTPFATTSRHCANPKHLAQMAKKISPKIPSRIFLDSKEAFDAARKINDPVLVTGSFFLVSDLRERWVTEEEILRARSSFLR